MNSEKEKSMRRNRDTTTYSLLAAAQQPAAVLFWVVFWCLLLSEQTTFGFVVVLKVPQSSSSGATTRHHHNHDKSTQLRVSLESRHIADEGKNKPFTILPTTRRKVVNERGGGEQPRRRNNNPSQQRKRPLTSTNADLIEQQVIQAAETLSKIPIHNNNKKNKNATHSQSSNNNNKKRAVFFPSVRDCNSALAQFGDKGDLSRALRLFGKMRKAALLQQRHGLTVTMWPTLVTYSALMSRSNRLSQSRVSLRLYRLLRADRIPADTKACNILMNSYVRLKQLDMAQCLLQQMKQQPAAIDVLLVKNDKTAHTWLPALQPNLVTFNTFLDGCSKVGDLDTALLVKQEMEASNITADAWTYTSLISTTTTRNQNTYPASSHRSQVLSGRSYQDPSVAFELLQEMKQRGIQPNGMTYSALIDAAGKCCRSDWALQGLRIMLQDKKTYNQTILSNEVGAWTAAINACGKARRLETAVKLFYAMPSFGVEPNSVTCGCLTDSLLRSGRTAETLGVLRYMKTNGIVPSEVMYTSLITRAERLVDFENKGTRRQSWRDDPAEPEHGETKAIEVYTELIKSLVHTTGEEKRFKTLDSKQENDSNTLLLKVFLVFQEMKATGAVPDLACFNAVLRACARAGDLTRAEQVLDQIHAAGLIPDDITWRQILLTAGKTGQSDTALSIWKRGLGFKIKSRVVDERPIFWTPSVESFSLLLTSHLYEASTVEEKKTKAHLFGRAVSLYEKLLMADESMGMDRMNLDQVLESRRVMLLVLQALVGLVELTDDANDRIDLCKMTNAIIQLDCLQNATHMGRNAAQALEKAKLWRSDATLYPYVMYIGASQQQ